MQSSHDGRPSFTIRVLEYRGRQFDPSAGCDLVSATCRVASGISFQSIVAGGDQTCGLATSGTVYCWSLEGEDELTAGRPAEVPGTYVSVSNGTHHTCGITTDGAAYCWGLNGSGRLGDGSNVGSETPVAVLGGLQVHFRQCRRKPLMRYHGKRSHILLGNQRARQAR